MKKFFYDRLYEYFRDVAYVLKGEADAASVFANTSDIGISREQLYVKFLEKHLPSRCNVFKGGFVFHKDGTESKQLDVIVTADTTPQFNFHNEGNKGKAFSPVEGTLGVASIKSKLTKKELFDSLDNIASVPSMESIEGRTTPGYKVEDYENWPYKIVFASDGLKRDTIAKHIKTFYNERTDITSNRRPDIIHVIGKYCFIKVTTNIKLPIRYANVNQGSYVFLQDYPDIAGLTEVIISIQFKAYASSHILHKYNDIVNILRNRIGTQEL